MADGPRALQPFAPAGGVRVIVPAKRLDAAKSRLRPILVPETTGAAQSGEAAE